MFPSVYLCLCLFVRALQVVMAAGGTPGARVTECVTKVSLNISCENLLDMDAFSKSDPLCVLLMNTSGPHWCEVSSSSTCTHQAIK